MFVVLGRCVGEGAKGCWEGGEGLRCDELMSLRVSFLKLNWYVDRGTFGPEFTSEENVHQQTLPGPPD